MIELRKRGHKVDPQRQFPVYYEGEHIGTLVPDLLVDDLVIADPKVVTPFNESHVAQMIGCLNITGLKLALLLNFKDARLAWKRIVRSLSVFIIRVIREIRGSFFCSRLTAALLLLAHVVAVEVIALA